MIAPPGSEAGVPTQAGATGGAPHVPASARSSRKIRPVRPMQNETDAESPLSVGSVTRQMKEALWVLTRVWSPAQLGRIA